jgi:hypothetical protein
MPEESSGIEAVIREKGLVVTVPTSYLKNTFELGLTTGNTAKITHDMDMLLYMARAFEGYEDGCHVGRFLDMVCNEAIENGEPFLQAEEDE